MEDKKRTRRDLVMGKTWKKGMAAVMTAVMVSGALAGCGSGAGQKTETAAAETAQTGAAAETVKDETTAAESSVAVTEAAEETEILVAAAASLKNAYEEELKEAGVQTDKVSPLLLPAHWKVSEKVYSHFSFL